MPDTIPTDDSGRGRETARLLLDIKAVNFRPEEPYKLTAGWASPVYIDCRWVISFLDARRRIIEMGAEMLSERIDMSKYVHQHQPASADGACCHGPAR